MYGVKCNVRAPHRFLRFGALCWVSLTNPGWAGERIQVVGVSRGGRMVSTYVDARDLHNFRAGWVRDFNAADYAGRAGYPKAPIPWPTREEAQAWADDMNERFAAQPVRPHAASHGRSDNAPTSE